MLSLNNARWGIIALALGLACPALTSGLAGDDFYTRVVLQNIPLPGVHGNAFDLFRFSGHATNAEQLEVGMRGWWADPQVQISYFRPLSSLTHALDYALWPNSPELMHAQNLFWFALILLLLSFIYDRVFAEAWISRLALLLFGIDDTHGFAIAWVANRNLLVALAWGLSTLLLHDEWRKHGKRWAGRAAVVTFLCSLLSGESGIAIATYLVAYALFLERSNVRTRLATLVPYGAVIVGWRVLYNALGYGTAGSGLVFDPVTQPLEFLSAAAQRLPILLSAEFAGPPANQHIAYAVIEWLPRVAFCWTLLAILLFACAFAPLVRRAANMRFLAFGCVVSVLPFCATAPDDRLLLASTVGGMGLLAAFIAESLKLLTSETLTRARRRRRGLALSAILLVHGVFAPLGLLQLGRIVERSGQDLQQASAAIPDTPAVEKQTVVLLNPPVGDGFGGYVALERAGTGRHRPAHVRWLATGISDVELERIDANTLRISQPVGFLKMDWERMHRSRERPLGLDHHVRLSDVAIRVTRVGPDGDATQIEARFTEPLESESLIWLRWGRDGFERAKLPGIGERTVLPKIDYWQAFLRALRQSVDGAPSDQRQALLHFDGN